MQITRREFITQSVAGVAMLQRPSSGLHNLTITEASNLIRSRRLSPVELTAAILKRIDEVEPRVRAFITVIREDALRAAESAGKEIVAGKYRGPLHGIPVGVKDTHYTKGVRTTAATRVLADFIPQFDATVVTRLKNAGAILIGKTTLPEFSFGGVTPVTKNPWDLSRGPGGSSGGNGAALAARMILGASGGDTSGSIRNPAATCGVVGMKPTYGRVSRHGVTVISWSLDHVGPMTRTVQDNAIMLNAVAGPDPMDDTSSGLPITDYTRDLRRGVKGLRIGIPKPAMFEGYHADVMKAYGEAIDLFKKFGAEVREMEMPPALAVIDDLQQIIRIAEAAAYQEEFLKTAADKYDLGTQVRPDVEAGSLITATQYLRSLRVRKIFVQEWTELFRPIDVFMTPGMPQPAGVQETAKQPFRRVFNVCGFPALVLPAGFSVSPPGLPVSLQIAAKPFQEDVIYRAAFAYESETHWHTRQPSL